MPAIPQTLTKHPTSKNPAIDMQKAFKLRFERGLTYQEIANHFGVSKPAVFERFKRISSNLPDPDVVRNYQVNRVTVLDAVETNLVNNLLNPSKLQKASLNNVAYSFQQVHSARRLESGLSTENVNVIARLEGIERSLGESTTALELLEHELQARPQDVGNKA